MKIIEAEHEKEMVIEVRIIEKLASFRKKQVVLESLVKTFKKKRLRDEARSGGRLITC